MLSSHNTHGRESRDEPDSPSRTTVLRIFLLFETLSLNESLTELGDRGVGTGSGTFQSPCSITSPETLSDYTPESQATKQGRVTFTSFNLYPELPGRSLGVNGTPVGVRSGSTDVYFLGKVQRSKSKSLPSIHRVNEDR